MAEGDHGSASASTSTSTSTSTSASTTAATATTPSTGSLSSSSSRNFRSAYYERVGFCGIEDKKISEALSTVPLDTEKLCDFCMRFDLGRYREEIWRLLLSVGCQIENVDTSSSIQRIHDDHFEQLKRSLEIILKILNWKPGNSSTIINNALTNNFTEQNVIDQKQQQSKQLQNSTNKHNQRATQNNIQINDNYFRGDNNQLTTSGTGLKQVPVNSVVKDFFNNYPGELVVLMYLIEIGELQLDNIQSHLDSAVGRIMVAMATVFVHTSSNLNNAYFLFRNFFKNKIKEQQDTLRQLYEKSLNTISHDMPILDKHIRSICSYDKLPCCYWFNYCFIDILDKRSLVRFWDRIVGGYLGFIPKLMKAIFVKLEPQLMASQNQQELVKILTTPLEKDESESLFSSVISNEIK